MAVLEKAKEHVMFQEPTDSIFPMRQARTKPMTYIAMGNLCRKVREQHPSLFPQGFAPRNMRRTYKTLIGDARVGRLELDLFHNHSIRGVSNIGSRHYDRSIRLQEKLAVIEMWDKMLTEAIIRYKEVKNDWTNET